MINVEKLFEDMWDQLVPSKGKCETLAGEMLRAVGKLRHDFYNNGMGNNTSGALNFLRHKGAIGEEFYDIVSPYTTGRVYGGKYDGDKFHNAIDGIFESAVKMISLNPQLMTIENNESMFDYEDECLSEEDCPACDGSGYDDEYQEDCDRCGGSGVYY